LNNKRKTKLRQGSDFTTNSSRNSKKQFKEKIIEAQFNNSENNYCLCRESFELTHMIQFEDCSEWFHKECIKIPKYQMKKTKIKNCPSCFFLHEDSTNKFPHFIERKIEFSKFQEILKVSHYLSKFLLDEKIDEIKYIQSKMDSLEEGMVKLNRLISDKQLHNEKLTSCYLPLHDIASLYLYIPVKIDSIENKLKQFAKCIFEEITSEKFADIKQPYYQYEKSDGPVNDFCLSPKLMSLKNDASVDHSAPQLNQLSVNSSDKNAAATQINQS
jgi:hypothetical protein